MNDANPKPFKSWSIGSIIIAACVTIVTALAASLMAVTFGGFKTGLDEAVTAQTRELSVQIVYNYENYISNIIRTSTIIQTDMTGLESNGNGDAARFSSYLADIVHMQSDILKIAVYDYESRRCVASSAAADIGETFDVSFANWFYEAINDPTVHVFSVPYAETGGDYKVNVSKRITLPEGKAGVLKIEISFRSFIELAAKSNLGTGGHITIIDPKYEVLYTSLPSMEQAREETPIVRDIVLGAKNTVAAGYNMSVNVDTLAHTKWRICVFINIDRLTEIEKESLFNTVAVSGAVLLVGILLLAVLSRTITKPMKRLEQAMGTVEKSDYFRLEEVAIPASREVEALIDRFNRMMRKIKELMDRLLTEQGAQRKSELKALQNQINPHFLYNTLDSIIWLIENEKNAEAGDMVVALAKFFRTSISGDSEVVSVRNELEHARNYLLIQNIRYAGSFDYVFDVEEEALDKTTMKLILQPIVENCIYHGLKNKIDRGLIKISARVEGDNLILSVADNGYGMRREAIDAWYKSFTDGTVSTGVGLKNIYQRVMIYYGGRVEMLIESELDQGTTITIKEPLNRDEER